MLVFVLSFIPGSPVFAADISPGVTVHTPAQIRQYIDNSGVDVDTPTTYTVTPSLYGEPGEMDSVSKNNSLKMLNNIRFVLGLQPGQSCFSKLGSAYELGCSRLDGRRG